MNIGMLWLDNDPKTALPVKITRAAEYYRMKYGRTPDMCLVNPAMLATADSGSIQGQSGSIAVRALRAILPGYLWIGVEDKLPTGAD